METQIKSPVYFTEGALNEISRLIVAPGFDHSNILRIGVKGGGCSGMSYILGFDKQTSNDTVYEAHGFHFVIEKAHEIYLAGMEIDWQGGLNSRGFTFQNPNASATCGCGTSFAV
ncbi:MAG: iron-sulfur cluster assembly accessory protein [Flavisolibacter sp.]|jgi:iron-sulfur cluster assembly protein|nr:iron-sulfur cluster assembly accessory protein [Flavisolibacter sp.]